uniref:Cut8 n=1 Tax=Lutzomyia longipalpis TaxID=7200 RepID=A0A1B0CEQ5_LUTLO
MTTQMPRRRSVLQELSATSDNLYLDDSLLDSPNSNLSRSFASPVPSPDEIVIRQRGRRSISITWSPGQEKTNGKKASPLKTPTKNMSQMVLRSSPRKRLLMSDGKSSVCPRMIVEDTKKLRIEEKSMAQINTQIPLATYLKGYSQEQLASIIQKLIRDNASLEKAIRSELPVPDIKPFESQLIFIKKSIYRSLPSSRLVKKNDSVAYSRASLHLTAFKKAIADQATLLSQSQHFDALMDYILMAWPIVRSTPIWENHTHNAIRRHCFKLLAFHCKTSLQEAGEHLGEDRLSQLSSQMNEMISECEI